MAHYAFLDENNIVTNVIIGIDEDDLPSGVTSWEDFYGDIQNAVCLRTSVNTLGGVHYNPETGEPSADQSKAFRMNYAGIGYIYDKERDAFIPPQPYESWVLNQDTCVWEAPIPMPEDGNYTWNESTQSWDEISEA